VRIAAYRRRNTLVLIQLESEADVRELERRDRICLQAATLSMYGISYSMARAAT
jgi:hypothetical protein